MHKRSFRIGGSDKENMYSEEVDYEEKSGAFLVFFSDEEVCSTHSTTMVHEEVIYGAFPLTVPTTNNDKVDIRREDVHLKAPLDMPRKQRGMRSKKAILEMILRKDISLEQIPNYLNLALVGRLCGKVTTRASLEQWI